MLTTNISKQIPFITLVLSAFTALLLTAAPPALGQFEQ
jgi:hypothetical protein